jgi:hypothetical protein
MLWSASGGGAAYYGWTIPMRMWIYDLVDRLMSGDRRTVGSVVLEMLRGVSPSRSRVLMLGVEVECVSLVGIWGWCVQRSGSWHSASV